MNSRIKGKQHSISAGIDIPFGDFSSSHNFGAGLDYSWSNHRFGLLSSIPMRPIGFTFNIGGDYFLGKNEMIALYNYQYPHYIYLHTYGGIIINPGKKWNLCITAGPALGLYSSNTQFNVGINLSGNCYISKKIALTPTILFMKESNSDPLWTAGLRGSIIF